MALLAIAFILAAGALWVTTPGVGDARRRAAAILAAHGDPSDNGNVPARVAAALVATEDSRFYSHHGLDPKGALRGAISFVRGHGLGGATLDAQLAKVLYLRNAGWLTIPDEAVLAVKLDAHYSKHEILAMYLDAVYFGHGAFGVVDASRTFFGVDPNQLSWGQAALLAGLVNAPSAYDPVTHLHLARERQRHVLDRLVATRVLSATQADQAFSQSLHPAIAFSG